MWMIHFHLESHSAFSFAMVFITNDGPSKSNKLPPPPPNLPKCKINQISIIPWPSITFLISNKLMGDVVYSSIRNLKNIYIKCVENKKVVFELVRYRLLQYY